MLGLPLGFAAPAVLAGLLALPLIWLLLRMTPPRPKQEIFPPLRILEQLKKHEETPSHTPWWLTALRMGLAALAIIALAGPLLNPQAALTGAGDGRLIVILDDGWASQETMGAQKRAAESLLRDALASGRATGLATLSDGAAADLTTTTTDLQLERLAALEPRPSRSEADGKAEALRRDASGAAAEIILLSNGVQPAGWDAFFASIARDDQHTLRVFQPANTSASAIVGVDNSNASMSVTMASLGGFPTGDLVAYDGRNRPLGAVAIDTGEPLGDGRIAVDIDLPLELRNDIARLSLNQARSAAGTYLLDEGSRRRRVAMLSGVSNELAQPLLEP